MTYRMTSAYSLGLMSVNKQYCWDYTPTLCYIIVRGDNMNINMTTFHNQARFMQDVRQGEKIIAQSDKELAAKPVEVCNYSAGELVQSTGTGTVIAGMVGKVQDKTLIGKFWRVQVLWGESYSTWERVQDIKLPDIKIK